MKNRNYDINFSLSQIFSYDGKYLKESELKNVSQINNLQIYLVACFAPVKYVVFTVHDLSFKYGYLEGKP